jgi:S1-C subfamily serine protease
MGKCHIHAKSPWILEIGNRRRLKVTFVLTALLSSCALPCFCVAQSESEHCTDLFIQYATAFGEVHHPDPQSKELDQEIEQARNQWRKVLEAGRQYLGECPSISKSRETDVLANIAEGLRVLGQDEDAIPILRRCITIDVDNAECFDELGTIEMYRCRFDEAKEAFRRVVEIGAFTKLNAILVDGAKSSLRSLDDPTFLAALRARGWCDREDSNPEQVASGAKRFGSGFFVTRQGQVLTNNHVVEGCGRLSTSDGRSLTVVDRDAKADLALLKADVTPDAIATFRAGPPPKQGDQVIAFGFPLPDILASEGNVSEGILSAVSGLQNDVRFVQISAPVQPGNSGGPRLDASGHVIGVVVSNLDALRVAKITGDVPQNVSFAVHWAEVRAFLDERAVAYKQAASSRLAATHDIAAEAKRFSIGIICTE